MKGKKILSNSLIEKENYLHKFLIIVIFLLVTNFITLGLFVYKNIQSPFENFQILFPLIDPARSIVEQKYFFTTIEPIRKEMKAIVEKYEREGNSIGIYFEFLNTGANISINQDTRFWPASLSKMPTVFATMKKVEQEEWKLSNEMVLFSEDKDEKFGELYKKTVGTRFTIEELLKETLINSDNTSHRILVRNLTSENYTDMFEALGMQDLFDENYDITAKEYSRIFRALYNASYLDRENSQKILTWLSQSEFNTFLNAPIPDDVLFSHKIGEAFDNKVFLDSGIVYVPNRPYLITVMIKVGDKYSIEKAQEIMVELSKAAYTYVANN